MPASDGPGRGVERLYAGLAQHLGVEIADVDARVAIRPRLDQLPADDAAAGGAMDETQLLAAPGIGPRGLGLRLDPYGARLVVGPEHAVAAADRAVAIGDGSRLPRNCHAHGAAMAGSLEHRSVSLACLAGKQ